MNYVAELLGFLALGFLSGYALRIAQRQTGQIRQLQREVHFWRRMVNEANFLDSLGRPCRYRNGMPVPFAPNGLPHKHDEEGLTSAGRIPERALLQITQRATAEQILTTLAPDVSQRLDTLDRRTTALGDMQDTLINQIRVINER